MLLLVVLVPVLAIQAFFISNLFQSRKAEELNANAEIARAVGWAFEGFIKDVVRQELAIGIAATTFDFSPTEFTLLLEQIAEEMPAVRDYSWVSEQGRILASNRPEAIGIDISDREYFKGISRGENWVVSDLIISKSTGEPIFTINRGIRDENGELLGLVLAAIIPERLDSVLALERAGDAGVSLIDSKGMHVYRHPTTKYTWKQRNWLQLYPEIEGALSGKEIAINVVSKTTGIERLASFLPVPSIGWVSAASRAEKEAVTSITSPLIYHGILFLGITLASFAFAVWMSRTIARPIQRIHSHVRSLGRGSLDAHTDASGPTETRALANALNWMVRELKENEEALRRSEERWNAAIENFGEGAIIATEDEQVIYWNPAARAMHGFTSDQEGIGLLKETPDTFELWTPDGSRLLTLDEWPMRRIKRGETVRNMELRLRRPDQGWEKIVSYSGVMVETASGERLIFLSVHDLTELRKAEETLRKSHHELEKRVAERTAQLEWRNRELQEFTSVAAHDLQEPLRKIQALGDLLEHEVVLPYSAKYLLSRMIDGAKRMQELIKNLLAYSRVSDKIAPFQLVDLKTVAEKVTRELPLSLDPRKPVVTIGDLPTIEADAVQIHLLLQNLIVNGIRYAKNGQRPVIKITGSEVNPLKGKTKAFCEIRIEDNGIGFEMKYVHKIFEPFERLHGPGEYGGTGMGLAICRKIVERHGGTIMAESQQGEGSTFIVRLPMRQTQ